MTSQSKAASAPGLSEKKAHLKRAPTFYCITGFKLVKGALFFILAIILYFDSTHDLPAQYRAFLNQRFVQSVMFGLPLSWYPEAVAARRRSPGGR